MKPDICGRRFWQVAQMAFLDIKVFNPNAKRYGNQELSTVFRKQLSTVFRKKYSEEIIQKKYLYNQRIMQVEHGIFMCLVLTATGGIGQELRFLAEQSSMANEIHACTQLITDKITFTLIKSISMCLRGIRSVFHKIKLKQPIKDNKVLSKISSKF